MRTKAFIAAPLLGTLVFLVSILVIINFNSSETAAVAETVSGAYHNRLVSLVEIYRTDMGSVFNIGLQRNIEYGLTSQCWFNFAPISTQRSLDPVVDAKIIEKYDDGNGILDENEEKRFLCDRASSLVKTVVCSKKADYLFGIATWATIIADQRSFEGVNLTASNTEAFLNLIGYNDLSIDDGTDLCEKLISGVEIDCKNYSETGAFQCCSSFDASGNCLQVVPGCEDGGQFFVRVSVQNDLVFSRFPRVYASDSAGNRIRAGAITDLDYNAPISYPLFKYLDAALRANHYLAYGPNGRDDKLNVGGEIGARRGIIEGSCTGGTSGCKSLTYPHFSTTYGTFDDGSYSDLDLAEKGFGQIFLGAGGVLERACQEAQAPANLETQIQINSQTFVKCADIMNDPQNAEYTEAFGITPRACPENNPSTYCAYINRLGGSNHLMVKFVDPDTTNQVDAAKPNEFCWLSIPSFED
ncbi:MAG: hypothetical protein ABIG96_00170 [Candidatus Micrarchaeota archaeon]